MKNGRMFNKEKVTHKIKIKNMAAFKTEDGWLVKGNGNNNMALLPTKKEAVAYMRKYKRTR